MKSLMSKQHHFWPVAKNVTCCCEMQHVQLSPGRYPFFLQKLQSYTTLLLQTSYQSNGVVENDCQPQQCQHQCSIMVSKS